MSEIKQTVPDNQPSVQIGLFDIADTAELAYFAVKAYSDIYKHNMTKEQIKQQVINEQWVQKFEQAATRDIILVAKADSVITGYIQFGDPDPAEEEPLLPNTKELRKLYVSPEMHGRGVGPQLMEAALATPALKAASQVYLWVWGENPRAMRFYEKYDFTKETTRHYNDDNGRPTYDWMMVCKQIEIDK